MRFRQCLFGPRRLAILVAVLAFAPLLAHSPSQAPARPAPSRPATTAKPAADAPVPFTVGETLTYDVSWSSYLVAGSARVSVRAKSPAGGSTAYHIVAEGQPTPWLSRIYRLYYKADTLLDATSLLSQQGSIYSEEGGRRRTKVTKFDRRARRATYEVHTSTRTSTTFPVPPRTQDALATLFAIRALPLTTSTRATIPVSDSGETFDVQVTVAGRETVHAAGRTVQAWKVLPVVLDPRGRPADDRKMTLWISDDAQRLPVRLAAEFAVGTFNLTLTSARSGG